MSTFMKDYDQQNKPVQGKTSWSEQEEAGTAEERQAGKRRKKDGHLATSQVGRREAL
jgi:hypothetical protein